MRFNPYLPSGIYKVNNFLITFFQKVDIRLLIFLVLCLNFLSFSLSDNEEAQLSLAKQFMDHAWMPDSFMFNEWPGNRLLFQLISGFFLKYFEFEPFVFFARIALFLAISFPLGAIFKKLEIKNLYALILFQIYALRQTYFGAEFLVIDYEVKSIAYIFVLTGVYYLLNNKYYLAVIFAVIGSYFHILAGGWFFVLLLLYSLFNVKSFALVSKQLLLFIVLLLPIAYYLADEIFRSGSVINGINIDWVYVYFRNAHHTAPLSIKEMLPKIILQVIVTGLLFLTTIFIFRKFKGEYLDKLYLLNVIVFSMVFISVVISLYDKTGFLLKFYLFRIAALGCFLMYLYVFLLLKSIPKMPALIKTGFFLIGFYMIVAAGMNTFKQIFHYDPKPDFQELVSYVKQNTNPKEIILNLGDYDLSFPRKTRRDEFVIFKFVPGGGPKIYEWYMRILARKNVADDLSQINNLKEKYKLNYLLCDHILDQQNCLKLLFRNKSYYFYKIL